jgi:hypothetical protein
MVEWIGKLFFHGTRQFDFLNNLNFSFYTNGYIMQVLHHGIFILLAVL